MLRAPVGLVFALVLLPAAAAAEGQLTPAGIVDFFTRDAPSAEAQAGGRARAVHIGPSGFGAEAAGAAAAMPEAEAGSLDLLITFDHDSARLTPAARRNLDAFVAALGHPALEEMRFAVDGHTDATGPEDYNQGLSERRAAAVVDYLVGHGVDGDRLAPRGFGETRPRTANPEDGANRRVETRRLE